MSGWVRQALADSTTTQQCPGRTEVLWWREEAGRDLDCVYESEWNKEEKKPKWYSPKLLHYHVMQRKAVSRHRVGGICLNHTKIKVVLKSLEKWNSPRWASPTSRLTHDWGYIIEQRSGEHAAKNNHQTEMEALQYMDSASADWQAKKWKKRNTTTGLPWGKKLINKAFVYHT